jgi:predicted lipid-binding transport protein (Tim44 family)
MMGGMGSFGTFGLLGGLFWLLIQVGLLALVIVGVVWVFRSLSQGGRTTTGSPGQAAPARTCPNCGRSAQTDWNSCPYCGSSLS